MITVFTRTTCAYCQMVKKLFDAKGVEYTAVNLDDNPDREVEASDISGVVSVPVTTNGKDFVVGFSPAKLLGLLG